MQSNTVCADAAMTAIEKNKFLFKRLATGAGPTRAFASANNEGANAAFALGIHAQGASAAAVKFLNIQNANSINLRNATVPEKGSRASNLKMQMAGSDIQQYDQGREFLIRNPQSGTPMVSMNDFASKTHTWGDVYGWGAGMGPVGYYNGYGYNRHGYNQGAWGMAYGHRLAQGPYYHDNGYGYHPRRRNHGNYGYHGRPHHGGYRYGPGQYGNGYNGYNDNGIYGNRYGNYYGRYDNYYNRYDNYYGNMYNRYYRRSYQNNHYNGGGGLGIYNGGLGYYNGGYGNAGYHDDWGIGYHDRRNRWRYRNNYNGHYGGYGGYYGNRYGGHYGNRYGGYHGGGLEFLPGGGGDVGYVVGQGVGSTTYRLEPRARSMGYLPSRRGGYYGGYGNSYAGYGYGRPHRPSFGYGYRGGPVWMQAGAIDVDFGVVSDPAAGLTGKTRAKRSKSLGKTQKLIKNQIQDNKPILSVKAKKFIKRNDEGHLMVDDLTVKDVANATGCSPFYLTSKSQLTANFGAYKEALEGLDSAFIGYAVKANHNMHILRYLAGLGCGAVLVSGNELKTAIKAGFDTNKMVFNGNGKMQEELDLAVEKGVLVNIDSEFDLDHIIQAGKNTGKKARAMLRINPDVDPKVHKYVSTGMASSKFGIENTKIKDYLAKIKKNSKHVELLGAHCHIGSTIKDVTVFKDAADKMVEFIELIRKEGFNLEYLNLGGGLGIDYERKGEQIPTPSDLVDSVREQVKKMKLKLIIEPGRSMVGDTTLFVNKVIGVKSNGEKNFIVIDGSMSELIRPSLYDTYQHIELAEPCGGEVKTFDVVGPVCESADFLGKDRKLPTPPEGANLVVYDAGAYCQAMSSVYNMRLTCPEFWVDGDELFQVRKEQDLDDYLSIYDKKPVEIKIKDE